MSLARILFFRDDSSIWRWVKELTLGCSLGSSMLWTFLQAEQFWEELWTAFLLLCSLPPPPPPLPWACACSIPSAWTLIWSFLWSVHILPFLSDAFLKRSFLNGRKFSATEGHKGPSPVLSVSLGRHRSWQQLGIEDPHCSYPLFGRSRPWKIQGLEYLAEGSRLVQRLPSLLLVPCSWILAPASCQ